MDLKNTEMDLPTKNPQIQGRDLPGSLCAASAGLGSFVATVTTLGPSDHGVTESRVELGEKYGKIRIDP